MTRRPRLTEILLEQPTLTTTRLILRPFAPGDAPAVQRLAGARRNPASGRVMQKLGMTYEGTLRQALRKWGRFEDVAMYAVLAVEWRERTAPPVRVGV